MIVQHTYINTYICPVMSLSMMLFMSSLGAILGHVFRLSLGALLGHVFLFLFQSYAKLRRERTADLLRVVILGPRSRLKNTYAAICSEYMCYISRCYIAFKHIELYTAGSTPR